MTKDYASKRRLLARAIISILVVRPREGGRPRLLQGEGLAAHIHEDRVAPFHAVRLQRPLLNKFLAVKVEADRLV